MNPETIAIQLQLTRAQFKLDVHLDLPAKGVTAIFGHSGSGKTTLLRCIAGLEKHTSGSLYIAGEHWQGPNFFLPTHKRMLGYVFQEPSLFPHLTAGDNLEYAIKRAKKYSANQGSIIAKHFVLELLGIKHLLERYPHQLSGGEQQRVAIARALLIQPKILLMDEPLASLDEARKQEIMPYLETLKSELDLPILYVSHSPHEVARLADQLIALEQGKVVAFGTLSETLASLDFPIQLGEDRGVVLNGRVVEKNSEWHLIKVSFSDYDTAQLWIRDTQCQAGDEVRIHILAKDVSITKSPASDTSILNVLPGTVAKVSSDSDDGLAMVDISVFGQSILSRITKRSVSHLSLTAQDEVFVQIKSAALVR